MEIDDVKKEIQKLQEMFLVKIKKFESKTGIYISEIYVSRLNTMDGDRSACDVLIKTSIEAPS